MKEQSSQLVHMYFIAGEESKDEIQVLHQDMAVSLKTNMAATQMCDFSVYVCECFFLFLRLMMSPLIAPNFKILFIVFACAPKYFHEGAQVLLVK